MSEPEFDEFAGRNWIYPNNMTIRPYQVKAVELALFTNAMIVLPTGFGKTFIAAVVMYNFHRWYPTGKIVFVAPTRPLVAQQIVECKTISGIPSSDCVELTGSTNRAKRERLWQTKRVFFATPQVIQNDLEEGILPAKQIKCLVIDEAHRAQGGYAYVELVRHLQDQNRDGFRIVALSATPGSDIERVRHVMLNLYIGDVMFRTESSIDLMSYRKQKKSRAWTVELSGKHKDYVNRFKEICQPTIREIYRSGLLKSGCDSLDRIARYRVIMLMEELRRNNLSERVRNKGRLTFCLAAAITMRHLYDMLTIYGIRPFYVKLKEDMETRTNMKSLIISNIEYDKLMKDIEVQFGDYAIPDPDKPVPPNTQNIDLLSSHPKLAVVKDTLEKHFTENSKNPDTRALVFCKYREGVYDVVQALKSSSKIVKPHLFVGQKMDARKLGLTQKNQIELIQKFKQGECNTLVATCVAEEGLDIGEIDLVISYDVSADPISGTQRRGRTGRKRSGDVIILMTKDIEEDRFKRGSEAKRQVEEQLYRRENYMTHKYNNAPRMVPEGMQPKRLDQQVIPVLDDEHDEAKPKASGSGTKRPRLSKRAGTPKAKCAKKSDYAGFKSAKDYTVDEDDSNNDAGLWKEKIKDTNGSLNGSKTAVVDADCDWEPDDDLSGFFESIEKRRKSEEPASIIASLDLSGEFSEEETSQNDE